MTERRRRRNADTRVTLDAARERGLVQRHAAKLARTHGATYHCGRCDTDLPVSAALDHMSMHIEEEPCTEED